MEEASIGFAPIAGPGIHTLILGSLPSRQSLAAGEYYGNPRNAFWRIMGELFGAGPEVDYESRTQRLVACGIGVWDVLQASVRPGSLDADIDLRSAVPNDFEGFIDRYPRVRRIAFNGRKSEELFTRFGCLSDPGRFGDLRTISLPSTSPAHAAMSFQEKLTRWVIVATPPEA